MAGKDPMKRMTRVAMRLTALVICLAAGVAGLAGAADFDRWPHEFFRNQSRPIGINWANLRPTCRIARNSRRAAGNERGELFGEPLDGITTRIASGDAKDDLPLA